MSAATSRPDVVVFDVNETLTDMSPIRSRLEQVGAPAALFDTWFASTLRDGFAVTAAGGYAEFADIARHVLTVALGGLADLPGDLSEAASHVLSGLPELDVHADVPDGLRKLRDAGARLVTLTNGAPAMSDGAFARAGIRDLFEQRLSVGTAGRWKPAKEAYSYAIKATGVAASGTALVAVHPWDVDGAVRAGLIGAWLNRLGAPYPPYMEGAHIEAASMTGLVERLLDR